MVKTGKIKEEEYNANKDFYEIKYSKNGKEQKKIHQISLF